MSTAEPHYPLKEAVTRFFPPEARVTVSTLRREIERGTLKPVLLGGRFLVSRSDIDAMLTRLKECPAPRSHRASTSARAPDAPPNGSSSTPDANTAQDAAEMTLQELKRRYGGTSPRSTGPKGKVIPLASP